MSADTVQVDPAVPERGRGPTVRRLGWGVADQAMSSIANFLLGVFVAKSLGAVSLGAFSLAFLTYTVVLNASRGLSTDPLIVRFSGPPDARWRGAVSKATGTALVVGIVSGGACILGGLVLVRTVQPAEVGLGLIALGAGLPGLMLQDSWRFAFFSCSKGVKSFTNDTVWTVLMVSGVVSLHVSDHLTVGLAMGVFGGSATLAAIFGLLQAKILPRPGLSRAWLSHTRQLGVRYLVDNVSASGAAQLRAFVLGAVAGLAAVGHVRAAEMVVGPFLVVLAGVAQVAVPEARRAAQRGSRALARFCLGLGASLALTSAAWGLTIMLLLPLGLGELLLGSVWEPAYALTPGVVATVTVACFSIGAASGIRALGQAHRSLVAQLVATSMYLVGGCGGAVLWGAMGAVWGAALARTVGVGVWWLQLRRGIASLSHEPESHLALGSVARSGEQHPDTRQASPDSRSA